ADGYRGYSSAAPASQFRCASSNRLGSNPYPPGNPQAGLVIIDESHLQFDSIATWMASPEWSSVPFIGLTATPWAKGMGRNYDDLLCPVSIQELIDEGYLSPLRVFVPHVPDLTGVRTIAGDFNEADLSEACDKQELIADI